MPGNSKNQCYIRIDDPILNGIKDPNLQKFPSAYMNNEDENAEYSLKQSSTKNVPLIDNNPGQLIQDKKEAQGELDFFASSERVREFILEERQNIINKNKEHIEKIDLRYEAIKTNEDLDSQIPEARSCADRMQAYLEQDLVEGAIPEDHKILFHCPLILDTSGIYDDEGVTTTYFPSNKITFLETWITVVRTLGERVQYTAFDDNGEFKTIDLDLRKFDDFSKFVMIAPLGDLEAGGSFDLKRIYPGENFEKKYEFFTIINKLKNLMCTNAKLMAHMDNQGNKLVPPEEIQYNTFIGLQFNATRNIGYTALIASDPNNNVLQRLNKGCSCYTSDTINFNESVRLSFNPCETKIDSSKDCFPRIYPIWKDICEHKWENKGQSFKISELDQYKQFMYFKTQIYNVIKSSLQQNSENILEICLSGCGAFASIWDEKMKDNNFDNNKKRTACILLMAILDTIANGKMTLKNGLTLSIPYLSDSYNDLYVAFQADLKDLAPNVNIISNKYSEPSSNNIGKPKICTYLNDNRAIPGNEAYVNSIRCPDKIRTLYYYTSYKNKLINKNIVEGQFDSAGPFQNAAFLNLTDEGAMCEANKTCAFYNSKMQFQLTQNQTLNKEYIKNMEKIISQVSKHKEEDVDEFKEKFFQDPNVNEAMYALEHSNAFSNNIITNIILKIFNNPNSDIYKPIFDVLVYSLAYKHDYIIIDHLDESFWSRHDDPPEIQESILKDKFLGSKAQEKMEIAQVLSAQYDFIEETFQLNNLVSKKYYLDCVRYHKSYDECRDAYKGKFLGRLRAPLRYIWTKVVNCFTSKFTSNANNGINYVGLLQAKCKYGSDGKLFDSIVYGLYFIITTNSPFFQLLYQCPLLNTLVGIDRDNSDAKKACKLMKECILKSNLDSNKLFFYSISKVLIKELSSNIRDASSNSIGHIKLKPNQYVDNIKLEDTSQTINQNTLKS